MTSFIASMLFVTLAEMGDKTQLLAMAFAARFAPLTVLAAVLAATLVNHGLAVVTGRLLTTVIPMDVISLVASLSFVLFGLWTIRGDTLEGEDETGGRFGPFMTVAIAFFVAELGDKTQLATISLAVRYSQPVAVLLGTTTGMVIADALGIMVGIVLGKRLPDTAIRIISATVFVFFGLTGAGVVLREWTSLEATTALLTALAVATLVAAHALMVRRPATVAAPPALPAVKRLPQSLLVLLLLVGWVASLDWATPVAAFDHWAAFALLGGVGWKLIHSVVRPRLGPVAVSRGLTVWAALVALGAGGEAAYRGLPGSLALVPGGLALLATVVALGGGVLATQRSTDTPLGLLVRYRLTIASGILLMAAAVTVVLSHLAQRP